MYFMNEKFNKNAEVEKFTTMLGIAVRLIVIDPYSHKQTLYSQGCNLYKLSQKYNLYKLLGDTFHNFQTFCLISNNMCML